MFSFPEAMPRAKAPAQQGGNGRGLLSRWPSLVASLAVTAGLLIASVAVQAATPQPYPGIGRAATPQEIAAWDIDVRPDFKGLPKGSGTVAQGQVVWEAKCASCHGIFGESNEVFAPIVGGTNAQDIKTGKVASLRDPAYPGRTTLMKLPALSTLWDYINRAMPWTAPKSLTTDEVYAVTAFILNLGRIVPDDFTLSERNMAQTQALLPNRNGMTTQHALWPGSAPGNTPGSTAKSVKRPDVLATACMTNCLTPPKVVSFLPDFARNAHGNLAEQNRSVGAQRGADTTLAPVGAHPPKTTHGQAVAQSPAGNANSPAGSANTPAVAAATAPTPAHSSAARPGALLQKYTCVACHGVDNKVLGPSFKDIAKKHGPRADAVAYLSGKINAGSTGVWGAIPMPAQALSEADAKVIAQWLAAGARN